MLGDEVDDALLDLERPGDIQEGGRLARTAKRPNTLSPLVNKFGDVFSGRTEHRSPFETARRASSGQADM